MALLEDQLFTKQSTLNGAGQGLFTDKSIPKGALIAEYTGTITTWKNADHKENTNEYLYYAEKNHVIDASSHHHVLARFVNDARGLQRIKGIVNNASFVEDKKRVFIQALKKIPAGGEILVSYGKEYWETVRQNKRFEKP